MNNKVNISIVTPSYDRRDIVDNSINSSLDLIDLGFARELIVIDDGSNDGTYEYLEIKYFNEIKAGKVRVFRLDENVGVTGAKNKGAQLALFEWVVFMDSDDTFIEGVGESMNRVLREHNSADIVFFRCLNASSSTINGPIFEKQYVDLKYLINKGTPGECLPAVKRATILRNPFQTNLRGSESLTYYEILHCGGKAWISDLIARNYDDISVNRLTSKRGIKNRCNSLYNHYRIVLKYYKYAGADICFSWMLKLVYYKARSLLKI